MSMLHGLYNISGNIDLPYYMGCTIVYLLHGRWVVQQYNYCIEYGLYNGSDNIHIPMHHGSYNGMSSHAT